MESLIQCHKISKELSGRILFKELSLDISKQERLGVIGPNGAGKSTLAHIINEDQSPDNGKYTKKNNLTSCYIKQKTLYPSSATIEDILVENDHNIDISKINKITSQLAIDDLSKKITELSGGWIKKVELARAFVKDYDFVVFDEPTNHLDLRSILWLEKSLLRASFAWICISHDRYFLDRVSRRILEINKIYPEGHRLFTGNFSEFQNKKNTLLQEQNARMQTLKSQSRREQEWLQQGAKARTTKAKFRVSRAHELQGELDSIKKMFFVNTPEINFTAAGSQSKKIFTCVDVSLKLDKKILLQNINFELNKGDKLALLGLNGAGKSSFLHLLLGKNKASSGKVKKADKLSVCYFDQNKLELEKNLSVKEFLQQSEIGASQVSTLKKDIYAWAKCFGFDDDKIAAQICDLSGGEKARLLIAKILLTPADLLILDEPTNDLDVETLEKLEIGLKSFGGSVIIVSHDRYCLENVCRSFWGIKDRVLRSYHSYLDWQQDVLQKEKNISKNKQKLSDRKDSAVKQKKKLSYMQDRELSMIPKEMEKLEAEIEQIKQDIVTSSRSKDFKKLSTLSSLLKEKNSLLEKKFIRWQELEDMRQGSG